MCTASWIVRDRDYRLYFNRDEQKSRGRAEEPRVQSVEGREVVAPVDVQGGGSWIAVNEMGLTVFLLNNYAEGTVARQDVEYRSRGELPILLASRSRLADALDELRNRDLSVYRPFFLGLIAPSSGCVIYEWEGEVLEQCAPGIPFLTTSSYRSREVEDYRRRRFLETVCAEDGKEDSDGSLRFHLDQSHEDAAFNPFMSRDDAETHCISVIEVNPASVRYEYHNRVPGANDLQPAKCLSIARKG